MSNKPQVTYTEFIENFNALNSIPTRDKDGESINDKLTYAVTKNIEAAKGKITKYNKKTESINAENAITDEKKKGAFMLDDRNQFQFDVKGRKARDKDLEELNESLIDDIDWYATKDLTRVETLPMYIIMKLNGKLFNYDMSDFEEAVTVTAGVTELTEANG